MYAVHPGLDLKDGNISATLDARAGPQLQAELRRSYKNRKLKPWEFACTYGYELPYKYVFHGALEECKNLDSLKVIYPSLLEAQEVPQQNNAAHLKQQQKEKEETLNN